MDQITKQKIREASQATRAKRKGQICKTFELKVDKSHLSKSTKAKLNLLLLESKWLYNYYLANDPLKVHWNQKQVQVKVGNLYENRDIVLAGAHVKQEILQSIKQSISSLSKAKKKGIKIGKIKFKSSINSINLKQYGCEGTYYIKGKKIRISHIPYLRVHGTRQLEGYEIANAKLLRKAGDYYFHITCYKDKEDAPLPISPIGIDFGIKHQLTLSVGTSIDYNAPFPNTLKNKYRNFSKKQKRSSNQFKARLQVQKHFEHWNNQKKDTINKIVKVLKDNFSPIIYQNDNIKGWQRLWGRKGLSTSLGGITSKLKDIETSIEVDRFFPSTKTCNVCQHKQNVKLEERIIVCEKCGNTIDRDYRSSINIGQEGLKQVGRDTADLKPMDIEPLRLLLEKLNTIPRVKASSVSEVGNS